MRLYLSLPISGHQIRDRISYADRVKRELINGFRCGWGYFRCETELEIITPFDVNENEDKDSYARKMGNDIEALLECDAIFLCEGWQNSKGCMTEFEVAKIYGKEIIFER